MEDTIKSALDTAKSKLDELVNLRNKIDKEILDWKKVVDSLSAVSEDATEDVPADIDLAEELRPFLKLGFTEGVRNALITACGYLTAPQIRDYLIKLGFDFSKYKQELVPVHNTLKRLEQQGEVASAKSDTTGAVAYKWISPIERALKKSPTSGPTVSLGKAMRPRKTFGQRIGEPEE